MIRAGKAVARCVRRAGSRESRSFFTGPRLQCGARANRRRRHWACGRSSPGPGQAKRTSRRQLTMGRIAHTVAGVRCGLVGRPMVPLLPLGSALQAVCLGPGRDPARRVPSRVRETETHRLCVGQGRALLGSTWRGPRDMRPGAGQGSGQAGRRCEWPAAASALRSPSSSGRLGERDWERERRKARAEWGWGGLAGGRCALQPATAFFFLALVSFFLGLVMLVTVFCRTAAVGGRAAAGAARAAAAGSGPLLHATAVEGPRCSRLSSDASRSSRSS